MLKANFPRAYLDVNRETYELDPTMFTTVLPDYVNTTSLRVAGFGVQQRRLVATRADRLAMIEITDEFNGHERRRFAVDEIDLAGSLQRTTLFDEQHRHEAVALLDERASGVPYGAKPSNPSSDG